MNQVDQRAEEILKRLPPHEPVRVAEVGVWDGRLSERLLRARPDLTLYMVDWWRAVKPSERYFHSGAEIARKGQGQHDIAKHKAIYRTAFAGPRALIVPAGSVEAAMLVARASLSLAFLDADHSYDAVAEDLIAWWGTVTPGGWIGGHDWDHPTQGQVREAVTDWIAWQLPDGYHLELGDNRTWFVLKPHDWKDFDGGSEA